MAVTLTGANGLFVRLGKIIDLINQINTHRSTTLITEVQDIDDEYADDRRDLLDDLYSQAALYRGSSDSFLAQLNDLASNTIIQMVYDDMGLTPQTIEAAMVELIRQMEASSDDVDASAIAATPAYDAGNNGDGKAAAAVMDGESRSMQYALAETVALTCSSDSQTGGVTQGQEVFTAVGEAAVDPLTPEWPDGSGASVEVTVISAGEDAGNNLLTNGDFEDFTVANDPDQWALDTGTAGGTIFEVGDPNQYLGTKALYFDGNGAQLTRISQVFDNAGSGTAGVLLPNTVYAVNVVTKVDVVPAAGVLRVSLQDSTDTILTDDAGTAQSFTISLPGETTTYAQHPNTFRTPRVIPDGCQFVIELTTALSNGSNVYIDEVAMAPATQLYAGGPFLGIFPGAEKWALGDRITLAVTNDAAGAFQQAFERLFGMRAMGLVLPNDSGGTETITDALIS